MCKVLQVSRSGFYAFRCRQTPSAREVENAKLLEQVREVHQQSRGTYGSPRVRQELARRGVSASRERVARLMRGAGLAGCIRRRFRVTTDSKHQRPVAPNRLQRRFRAASSDQVWCADITYIQTARGWAYLAAIIDLGTRLIVGWSLADHMRASLVEDALRHALSWRSPAKEIIHHSDRGSQYASESYQALLAAHGISSSMSRAGDCYDNAVIESFFGTFKQEWAHHHRWQGVCDARAATLDYIEVFYNRQRIHSSIGYKTPMEADRELERAAGSAIHNL